MKHKIIFSSYDSIDNPNYGGGGAIAVHKVAKRLSKNNIVKIISWNFGKEAKNKIDNVNYQRIGFPIWPKLDMLIYQFILGYYAKKEIYDVWFESFCPPFTTALLPIYTSKKVVGVAHMLASEDMTRKYKLPIFEVIEKFGLRFYNNIVVTSDFYKKKLIKFNHKANITIIPNGVDKFSIGKHKKKNQIIFMGRIEIKQKGLDILISAFEKIILKSPNSKLIIAGIGSAKDVEKLNNMIQNSTAKDNIKYIGWVDGKAKIKLLTESKMMAVPSRFETFSMSTLDALSNCLPVVAFDIEGLNWAPNSLVSKSTPFNTDDFAKKSISIINRKSTSYSKKQYQDYMLGLSDWNKVTKDYQNLVNRIA